MNHFECFYCERVYPGYLQRGRAIVEWTISGDRVTYAAPVCLTCYNETMGAEDVSA